MKRPLASFGFVALSVISGVQLLGASTAGAAPPGTGLVTDAVGGVSGWAFDRMAAGLAGWVLGGVGYFVDGVLNFLKTSARPQVEAAWFAGPGSPFATVRNLAGVVLVGFLFLGLLQGLVQGDPGAMVRRLAADVPMAVLGMVATVAVVATLLDLTDALSTAVLDQSSGQSLRFLSGLRVLGPETQGFAVVVIGLVAILAALFLWMELMVRSALVYLLVAVSPLAFAVMVWPAARGVLRRTAHLLLAVILSKFVIAVALAVGVAALGGPSNAGEAAVGLPMREVPGSAGAGSDLAVGLGTLLIGAVVLSLAAFAPFIVLRLIPVAEAALVAQGVSRGPVRATQSGLGTYYYVNSVSRLGGPRVSSLSAAPMTNRNGAGRVVRTGVGDAVDGAGTDTAAAAANAAPVAGRPAAATARQSSEVVSPHHPSTRSGPAARREPPPTPPDPPRRTT